MFAEFFNKEFGEKFLRKKNSRSKKNFSKGYFALIICLLSKLEKEISVINIRNKGALTQFFFLKKLINYTMKNYIFIISRGACGSQRLNSLLSWYNKVDEYNTQQRIRAQNSLNEATNSVKPRNIDRSKFISILFFPTSSHIFPDCLPNNVPGFRHEGIINKMFSCVGIIFANFMTRVLKHNINLQL